MPDEIYATSTEIYFTGDTKILATNTEQIPNMQNGGQMQLDSLIEDNATTATTTDYQGLSALLLIGCVVILIFGIIRILLIKKPDEKR